MNTMTLAPRAADISQSEPSVQLLGLLKVRGYQFTTPTPATHRKVLRRAEMNRAVDLRGVFGWSLPFPADLLPREIMQALERAGGLRDGPQGFRSAYRVASLGPDLVMHSAFPPSAEDAVFFGPDTYRFARLLRDTLGNEDLGHVIDIGTGSGAGALVVARQCKVRSLTATDVNATALAIARTNLQAAGILADFRLGSGLDAVSEQADLIIANPPFIAGDGGRTYRDGGDMIGARLSLEWAVAASSRLAPCGRFILYTGSAIVDGGDALHEALSARLDLRKFTLRYEELDPDIFGGQLSAKGYERVERIAAVGAVITRL